MRHVRTWWVVMLSALLFAAGCADAPTAPSAAPDRIEAGAAPSNDGLVLDPVIVIGTPQEPTCDPWTDPNWCEGDDGDQCMTSYPGTNDTEYVGTMGCGTTGPGTGPGGGNPSPSPSDPPPPEPEQPDTCKTGEQVVDAPDVWTGFQELWLKSKLNGVEMGGWIVSDGSTFRLVPFQNANFTACGIDIYESPPAGTVSMLHTHPWALFTVNPCGYINTGTPSQEDIQALQQTGLSTGYFLDEEGIGKFTATGGEQAQRIDRCGY